LGVGIFEPTCLRMSSIEMPTSARVALISSINDPAMRIFFQTSPTGDVSRVCVLPSRATAN
jgi:hypothetical protein